MPNDLESRQCITMHLEWRMQGGVSIDGLFDLIRNIRNDVMLFDTDTIDSIKNHELYE